MLVKTFQMVMTDCGLCSSGQVDLKIHFYHIFLLCLIASNHLSSEETRLSV